MPNYIRPRADEGKTKGVATSGRAGATTSGDQGVAMPGRTSGEKQTTKGVAMPARAERVSLSSLSTR